MTSIRKHLLRNLLIGMVLIASITGLIIYRHVRGELDELYNAHLRQIALFMVREQKNINFIPPNQPAVEQAAKVVWEEEDYLIQWWNREGVLLAQEVPATTTANIPLYENPGLYRKRIGNESWRIFRADSGGAVIQVAQPEAARQKTINETSMHLLLPLALQVPLLILLAWMSVRRGLRPLDFLSQEIAQRQPNALNAIEATDQPEELRTLVVTLNDLLSRLNAALQQQRHFIADAAHELRTPIAALQLQLDLLQRAETQAERDHAIVQLINGLQRATHLTQQLLSIARAESGVDIARYEDVDLSKVIESVFERHLPTARAHELDLGVTQLDPVCIRGDRADIETVIDNLVSNAIRYTAPNGRVDVALNVDRAHAFLQVTDTGPGIPAIERTRVFDRFYRILDKTSDVRAVEGSGLGLAIVKTICDRYGATIYISDGYENRGTLFTIRWPVSDKK